VLNLPQPEHRVSGRGIDAAAPAVQMAEGNDADQKLVALLGIKRFSRTHRSDACRLLLLLNTIQIIDNSEGCVFARRRPSFGPARTSSSKTDQYREVSWS